MTKPCMVVFDDGQCLYVPMGWDTDCDGALCCVGDAVVFPDRTAARRAINISTAYAKLRKSQGLPWNEDFIETIRHVKIAPVVMARADE